MESHDEREMTWGKERESRGLQTTICTVFFLCVLAEATYSMCCSLHVFLCTGKQTVTQIRGKALEEWSQTGISRKWWPAKQQQRDCIHTSAAPLFRCPLALLLRAYFAQRKSHVLGVCLCCRQKNGKSEAGRWLQVLWCAALLLTYRNNVNIMIQ